MFVNSRSLWRWFSSSLGLGFVSFTIALLISSGNAGAVDLISVSIGNKAGNSASNGPIANSDGNIVAFYSDANDLVRGDTNQSRDVFVRDRSAGTTEIVSISSAGELANRGSHVQGDAPALNGSGSLVAYYSDASNLVANDDNDQTDVFVRNRSNATTQIVSVATNGTQGNGPSLNPSMDLSGNLVAFQSLASNLTAGDSNGVADVFVRNRTAGTTERICDSIQGNGASFAPAISADGNVVAFTSAANNLVTGDNNGKLDVFTCDRRTGSIEIISISSLGILGDGDSILPAISSDGRFVAYKSLADNLVPNDHNEAVDVFVRDRGQALTERVSVSFFGGDANEGSFPPSISHDGRFVAFGSLANNLVTNDLNSVPSVFVRDITIGITLLVDLTDAGEQANGGTPDVPPAISGDGRQIGYTSFAFNLSPRDNNETSDVFLGRNPFFCDDENPCPLPLVCVDGMCVEPGGTRTPTPTVTGTPTRTPTADASDCCQCDSNACEQPSINGCPATCGIVRDAVCLNNIQCATFTPTPSQTPTNTAGPNDCCQCPSDTCQQPSTSGCPAQCAIVNSAACLAAGKCATFTPTLTPDSRTPTSTPTVTPCAVGTPCPGGQFPNCSNPSDPCTCNGCQPCATPQAPCPGGMACVFDTPNSCACTCEPTPVPSRTLTPTTTITPTQTVTATTKELDRDACQCAVTPQTTPYGSGGLVWLSGAAALMWRQRRRRTPR